MVRVSQHVRLCHQRVLRHLFCNARANTQQATTVPRAPTPLMIQLVHWSSGSLTESGPLGRWMLFFALALLQYGCRFYSQDCTAALTVWKDNEAQATKKRKSSAPTAGPSQGKQTDASVSALFDLASTIGKPLPCISFLREKPDKVATAVPTISTLPPHDASMLQENDARKFAEDLLVAFKQSLERNKSGAPSRASKTMTAGSSAHHDALKVLQLIPWEEAAVQRTELATTDDVPQELRTVADDLFLASAFVIAGGNVSCANEKDFLPCVRMSYQGTRTVIGRRFVDVVTSMKAMNLPVAPQNVRHQFQTNLEVAKHIMQRGADVFWGTVVAGEALFLPAGYILCESATNERHIVGVRVPLVGRAMPPS